MSVCVVIKLRVGHLTQFTVITMECNVSYGHTTLPSLVHTNRTARVYASH